MTHRPLISVVMAVYNGARFLDEAVNSIRRQTLADFECLVVNDGSTDRSLAILQSHAAEDPRVRVLDQPNQGLCASLNRGCREARGQLIARMDADDIAWSDRFEKQAVFLEAHPHVGALGGAVQYLDENGPQSRFERFPCDPQELSRALASVNSLAHPAVMMRRSAYDETGGYRLPYSEDYDLWLRIEDKNELANLPDVILYYRQHSQQRTFVTLCQTELMALAARFATARRRATGQDPFDGLDRIDWRTLLAIGIPPEEIRATLCGVPRDKVGELIRAGHLEPARELVDEMERILRAVSQSRPARAELAWIRSKICQAQGMPWRRAGWILRSYWLDGQRLARPVV